jgi:DNA replication protein DnaC
MNAVTYDDARLGLMLTELRLPTIGQLWSDFTQRADKEGWPATRLLGALLEHELAERVKRRIERHRIESHLDPAKTLDAFDFGMVPMVSKSWHWPRAIRGSRKAPQFYCSGRPAEARVI